MWRNRLMKELMKRGNPNYVKPSVREALKKTRWDIVRGDKVQVIGHHPEAGKQGIIKQVIRKLDRVLVHGVNMHKKHIKGNPDRGIKGKTVQRERSIHYSKVNLVCPVTNKPTRVMRKILEDGTKVRVSKKSGAIIPKPELLKMRRKPVSSIITPDDTVDEDVWSATYVKIPFVKKESEGIMPPDAYTY